METTTQDAARLAVRATVAAYDADAGRYGEANVVMPDSVRA